MAEDTGRCTWFEDRSHNSSEDLFHARECKYSTRDYYINNNRCIFHYPKSEYSDEDSIILEDKLRLMLKLRQEYWVDSFGNKYIDLYGFEFPNSFHLSSVLKESHIEHPLCLQEAQLPAAYLFNAVLIGANIANANLQDANLYRAKLQGSNLTGTILIEVNLNEANLNDACFDGTQLQGAKLHNSYLPGVRFFLTNFQGAILRNARLQGADLSTAYLQGADLSRAQLQGADLSRAQLQGAKLVEAHLQGAKLMEAHLQGADLRGASLQGANLEFAKLQGVKLIRSKLQGVNFKGADFSSSTTFRPKPEWEQWISDEMKGGLEAAKLQFANMGEGKSISLNFNRIIDCKLLDEIVDSIETNIKGRGVLSKSNNGHYLLDTQPTSFRNAKLQGVDLSHAIIAGTDFSTANLDASILRNVQFDKRTDKSDENQSTIWRNKWNRHNRWNKPEKLGWLRKLLTNIPFIGRRIKKRIESKQDQWPELPIFNGANIEAADWADNREAQRNFVYAEYIRQFKKTHPIIAAIWWLFADYGRSLLRWAVWSLGFAAAFGAIYHWVLGPESFVVAAGTKLTPLLRSFYYSVVTFTTLGFGDIVPKTDPAAFWVALEVALGYVMLGGLISIFAVKIARRD